MSQKRKKKGREQRRQTALAATAQPPAKSVATPTSTPTADQSPIAVIDERVPTPPTVGAADTVLLRRDLTRVAIVVAVVIAALVAMVMTNNANGWLDRIADELYRWLKLG